MSPSKRKTGRATKAGAIKSVPPSIVPVTGTIRVRVVGKSDLHAIPSYHEDRHASIAEAAYFRSQHRGFAPGHELEDWLAAEEEVDQRLIGEGRAS
jgi:hypothetical protein